MPSSTSTAGKLFHLHKLMAMTTVVSPPLSSLNLDPLAQAGGGTASEALQPQPYLSHSIQASLKYVYDKLRGKEKKLSRDKLAEWMKSTQDQPADCLDKESYKFEEFLETVYYNRGFDAIKAPDEEKDLTKPISNYFISSSHNTYLDGNQWTSKSSTDAYKNVLLRGCRCIEIDVHNGGEDTKPSGSESPALPSPKNDHKRHLSTATLSSLAAEAVDKGGSKYKEMKGKLSGGSSSGLGIKDLKIDETKSDALSVTNSVGRAPSVRSMRNGEPIVLHGWTLTAPVAFRDVCKVVRENAFVTSQLPIIVSLEVHANTEQQELMVSIMKEEWAGYLVDQAHETCNPDERLPRLEELLGKILIKVKKALEKVDPALPQNSLAVTHSNQDRESTASISEEERAAKKKVSKICENLSNLGIYTHSEHFVSFEAKSAKKPSHIFSIGETQILDLHKEKRERMFAHNRDYFMRAYPAGFRVNSSNLDPSIYWRKGIQMVALNWQKMDEGVMLNEGMFAGEKGWVLKPEGYRSTAEPIPYKTLQLRVTIFGGQHLPLPPDTRAKDFRPHVKCELHAERPEEKIPSDDIKGRRKARVGEWKHKTAHGKGDHLDFGPEGTSFEFPVVERMLEELSFVRYVISYLFSFSVTRISPMGLNPAQPTKCPG
ncbi:PLC-like phosphodiesterase [Bisporella sp. PMI_857]|nr:PLC-like phosphodiesterase [Bisporella sp. PMI_857]